jgi:hypothetical protein
MRKEKALISMLRGLVELLAEESARNPEFSSRLEALLGGLSERKATPKKARISSLPEELPDVHAEWKVRDETDFRHWLRDQPIPVLRAVIRTEDIDATRRTPKWKEAEKLADFITDSLRARQSRGSAFIGRGGQE